MNSASDVKSNSLPGRRLVLLILILVATTPLSLPRAPKPASTITICGPTARREHGGIYFPHEYNLLVAYLPISKFSHSLAHT
jgi:hypothetical protein